MIHTMNSAVEVDEVRPGLLVWHRFDAAVKADLFSTGIASSAGLYLVDPIATDDEVLAGRLAAAPVAGVIATNANHARAAAEFAQRYSVAIYAHPEAGAAIDSSDVVEIAPGTDKPRGLSTVAVEGAPPGEIAIHCAHDGGTLILGDALVNFGSHGFAFLPAKYCSNARLMRKSLRRLLDYEFDRMLFAHGTPIVADARARLAELLEVGN